MTFRIPVVLAAILANLAPLSAKSQIYIANFTSATIGVYSFNGSAINTNLITGIGNGLCGLAADTNGHLLAASYYQGNITKFTISGTILTTNLIPGLVNPTGIVLDGNDNLYVADSASYVIGKYSISGATINSQLISDVGVSWGMAVNRQNGHVFELNYLNGSLGEFTSLGTEVNAFLISGLRNPKGIARDADGNLYVGSATHGTVGKYSPAGAVINSALLSGLGGIDGLACDKDGYLYVTHRPNPSFNVSRVGVYQNNGTPVNAALISGLNGLCNAFVISPDRPTLAINHTSQNEIQVYWPTKAIHFTLESSANGTNGPWLPVTNAPISNGSNLQVQLPATPSSRWFRLRI